MVNYVKVTKYRKTFQNKIFQNWILRNTHCHQPFDFYGIAQNSSCGIAQNLSFAKCRIGQFCEKWLLRMIMQIVVFCTKNRWAKEEKICVSFRKNCAKVLRMETLIPTGLLSKFIWCVAVICQQKCLSYSKIIAIWCVL